jgi:hypothetical protein
MPADTIETLAQEIAAKYAPRYYTGTPLRAGFEEAIREALARVPAQPCATCVEKDSQYAELAAVIEAVCTAIEGEPVSDFMESFPTVRRVVDLKSEADRRTREIGLCYGVQKRLTERAEAAEQRADAAEARVRVLEARVNTSSLDDTQKP